MKQYKIKLISNIFMNEKLSQSRAPRTPRTHRCAVHKTGWHTHRMGARARVCVYGEKKRKIKLG